MFLKEDFPKPLYFVLCSICNCTSKSQFCFFYLHYCFHIAPKKSFQVRKQSPSTPAQSLTDSSQPCVPSENESFSDAFFSLALKLLCCFSLPDPDFTWQLMDRLRRLVQCQPPPPKRGINQVGPIKMTQGFGTGNLRPSLEKKSQKNRQASLTRHV